MSYKNKNTHQLYEKVYSFDGGPIAFLYKI